MYADKVIVYLFSLFISINLNKQAIFNLCHDKKAKTTCNAYSFLKMFTVNSSNLFLKNK